MATRRIKSCEFMMAGRRRGRGEQALLLSFIWESRGSKTALIEIQKNPFLDIDMMKGGQISYVNKQNMIGREKYLYS